METPRPSPSIGGHPAAATSSSSAAIAAIDRRTGPPAVAFADNASTASTRPRSLPFPEGWNFEIVGLKGGARRALSVNSI
jgi:hypothetical protein